jgi:chromosomal replication initiator protein
MSEQNIWGRILKVIESQLNEGSFNTWLKPAEFVSLQKKVLTIRVPNKYFKDWILNNYSSLLYAAASQVNAGDLKIRFVCATGNGARAAKAKSHKAPASVEIREISLSLNPKYTFSNFVVGPCNQFAHAAARAVADRPFRTYNPFFVYGGVGLGKTHLVQAIGHHVLQRDRRLTVLYIPAERFMNHLIHAIRTNTTHEFREKYRKLDILIIDDIQFLAGKERTQEEFFHTFNALFDAQKHIIISSDHAPKEIPTLEERLRSRFEWGLIADLQAPDLETKLAILRKKSLEENVHLPDDVADFLASSTRTNIRELEGSLIRLIAFSSLFNRPIDLQFAREILKDLVDDEPPARVSIETICKLVCEHYGLRPSDLKSKNNAQKIALPRQIAMFLTKLHTASSYPQIGQFFGGKHHTTVIHSVKKVDRLMKKDKDFNRFIDNFNRRLKRS